MSPSASVSPSGSSSSSSSPSLSPSASLSPSTSISPSASASPSFGAPSGSYNVALFDQGGYDVLEGVGVGRSAFKTEHKPIIYSSTSVNPCIDESDALTLKVDNNLVPGAVIQIDLYYALGA